jgi:hypothetical protein
MVVEIYPRVLTGRMIKSDRRARRKLLSKWKLPEAFQLLAEESEDALDAAVSALVMSRYPARYAAPSSLEGMIWLPMRT